MTTRGIAAENRSEIPEIPGTEPGLRPGAGTDPGSVPRYPLAARRDATTPIDGAGMAATPPMGARRAFREGVLVETLNPKTAAFFLAFVPQFVDPAAGSIAAQFVLLGTISVALNTLADIVVAFAADGIRTGAAARPALMRRLQQGSAAAMIALGVGLALAKRPAS